MNNTDTQLTKGVAKNPILAAVVIIALMVGSISVLMFTSAQQQLDINRDMLTNQAKLIQTLSDNTKVLQENIADIKSTKQALGNDVNEIWIILNSIRDKDVKREYQPELSPEFRQELSRLFQLMNRLSGRIN